MYAPAADLVKATLVDPRDAAPHVAECARVIFCAEWGATQTELASALLPHVGAACARRACSPASASTAGTSPVRGAEQAAQEDAGDGAGPEAPDGRGLRSARLPRRLRGRGEASGGGGEGRELDPARRPQRYELRGQRPLLLADLSARLVDVADVKYQDLYFKAGDDGQGYTKRLNLAATLRMTTPKTAPRRTSRCGPPSR